MSNSLGPDQARHFVGPDLGPNGLQRLSVDHTRGKELNDNLYKKILIRPYFESLFNVLVC